MLDKGAIYYECSEKVLPDGTIDFFSPEKTVRFLNSCLNNNFSIIVVNTVHSHDKIKERFIKIAHPMICFIDCTHSESQIEKSVDKKTPSIIYLPKDTSLTYLNLAIKEQWKKTEGKKVLFIESGSAFFLYHKSQDVFRYIHDTLIDYGKEGLVVFKFVNGSIDSQTEHQLKYFFDIIIKE